MATNRRAQWEIFDYSTYDLTEVILSGELRYFNNVDTAVQNVLSIQGDGTSQLDALPFRELIIMNITTNDSLESFRIANNRIRVFNNSASTKTIDIGTTGSPNPVNIYAYQSKEYMFDGSDWRELTNSYIAPIGSIIAWHKSFTGVPTLPANWVECDGSAISDSESPLNGQTVPDLNGDARFLRGASTSGTTQSHSTEDLFAEVYFGGAGNAMNRITTPSWTSNISEGTTVGGSTGSGTLGTQVTELGTGETRPKNMSVVWIIRIK